jgi:phenylacetate-coenzyme A ligase PaaK-like adenylate-forming protein
MGFMHRQWSRVGYTSRERKATFRGVSFGRLRPREFWQENRIYNELQFSPFLMTERNLSSYVEKIIEYSPSFFHGYPSAVDVLAEFIVRHDLVSKIPPIKAILLGSEQTWPSQRRRMERAFQTRVFSWYGHSERVVLAGECEVHSSYHQFPDYGLMEIIDEFGEPLGLEGDRGEIVGTGFYNRCMPLIRYRTEDFATRLSSKCECGRRWDRFEEVDGRWKQDMIIGSDGNRISLASLNMHGSFFDNVARYQYYQDVPGTCVLKIVARDDFRELDRLAIQKAYQDKLGDGLEVLVRIVRDIPLTPRGKLKMLVSRLARDT